MEPTRAAYDDVAEAYNETLDPEGVGLEDPIFEEVIGDVQGKRVLALACGQGRDARRLADLGADVVGIDISAELLAFAQRFEETRPRGIRYEQGDAQDLASFPTSTFDLVVCHMALMDMPDLGTTIEAAARVLRTGGGFVASIVHPCYGAHLEAIDEYLANGRYEKVGGPNWLPPHAYHRPLSIYINTLASAGFAITQMVEPDDRRPAGGVPNLLYMRSRLT